MQDEFLKSLIALLAQSGGQITLPMRELQQLGLQITLADVFSEGAASLTLRLAAKIYYVPAAPAQEVPCPTAITNPAPAPSTISAPADQSRHVPLQSVDDQIAAVNSLNNRAPIRRKRKSPKPRPPREAQPPSQFYRPASPDLPSQAQSPQSAHRQHSPAPAAAGALNHQAPLLPSSGPPRSIRKDDLSLFLREQAIGRAREAHSRPAEPKTQYPWEVKPVPRPRPELIRSG